jgi:hypothetical protein
MLRTKEAGQQLPVFLSSGNNGNLRPRKVIVTRMKNQSMEKSSCNVSANQSSLLNTSNTNLKNLSQEKVQASSGPSGKSTAATHTMSGVRTTSLQKQFEHMELTGSSEKPQSIPNGECSDFVVNTLTTQNQRDSSVSSQNSVAAYAQKILKQNLFQNKTQVSRKPSNSNVVQPP